jgi:valyl-tRNA synthetase
MMKINLNKVFKPQEIEQKWYQEWIGKGIFHANNSSKKKPYCIVIPPPNITGSLHLGHALDNTIQDILIRGRRMQGFEALWIPGTDHAGIATQNVVEKELAKERKTRNDLGREEFTKRVWKWKEEYGSTIIMQLKRLGVSCDWERERFTLDPGCSKAVREAFVRLYGKKLIYRGQRIINWCPRCLTALSDLEVEHKELRSKLWHLHYRAPEGGNGIIIATTRPETILADTAVCVHPEDERYKALIGKEVILPVVGRKLPVISDKAVDPSFGTGALKITPAHDPVDFDIGQAHGLPMPVVINEKGIMNNEAGRYEGMDRFRCREAILEDLKTGEFLVREEDYIHSVGHCYRCHTVIEPHLSYQWFVRMKDLAEPGIAAVKEGRVKFVPEKYEKNYLYWMENIRDWCISRQLWWGHRIPVWSCESCGHVDAYNQDPAECPKCRGTLIQEQDVLDTWFSSGLWPISTMGWPEETADLNYFYPTDVLVTARDIIFLWVARMIMMGLEFRNEVPFHDVYIHATILDKDGRRMSKSKGTGVDPLVLIDKYGADVTRFGLIYLTSQGQDIKFSEARFEMSRNFANKIWNAARFCLSHISEQTMGSGHWHDYDLCLADRWILSRINNIISLVTKAFKVYSFDTMSISLYDFFWDEFCDWYIEIVKPVLSEPGESRAKEKILKIVDYIFSAFLRLLHPIMPFITEELWHLFPNHHRSISVEDWPDPSSMLIDDNAERQAQAIFDVVRGIRSLRSEMNMPPKKETKVFIHTESAESEKLFNDEKRVINDLAVLSEIHIERDKEKMPHKAVSTIVNGNQIFIPLEELEDIDKLTARMERELQSAKSDLEACRRKLQNEAFINNAPESIIETEKNRELAGKSHVMKLEKHLENLKKNILNG